MLVMTRKPEQIIVIGDIVIRVLETYPGRVKLGIEAPADVAVHRGEVAQRIAAELAARGAAGNAA